jgi:D-arabinose 1-dehydrogenase-like Zn-dependent alcohol dehydrogenase
VKPEQLAEMTHEVALSDIVQASDDLLAGRIRGRTVVDVDR